MKKKELVIFCILNTIGAFLVGVGMGINLSKHSEIINHDYFYIISIILLFVNIILFGKKYQNLLKTLK